jgi:hypothetical protein
MKWFTALATHAAAALLLAVATTPASAQAPTPEELAARRVAEIKARLNELDLQSIRPLRAITDGTADAEDREKLAAINAEIEMLRTEMQGVEK